MKPSIWELETFYRNRDIVIVGAGFTGLWSAIALKEKFPEKSILVVEKNNIPLGASTRNAGFSCFGSLTEIISDSKKMGWEKTLDLVKMRFEGLQKIQKTFQPDEIDYEKCGGFEMINDEEILSKIQEVNLKLKPITGSENTFVLSSSKISEFGLQNAKYLVENSLEEALHSGKLVQKLLEKAQSLGVEFLFGSGVLEIIENDSEVELRFGNFTIKPQKLVIATNAFCKDLVPEIDVIPVRGQILLTEPIENLKLRGTFHYDEGFYYFRNLGNRILLGGARNLNFAAEQTAKIETTEVLQNHLEDFLRTVILPADTYQDHDIKIAHRWSGIMAMGKEKSPIVKHISARQIVAVRLSGMGVALAPKIGKLVAEMVS